MIVPLTLAVASASSGSSCSAADPAIVSVTAASPASNDASDHVTVHVTVTNLGKTKQASNTLDSVALYLDRAKTDVRGLQPLKPGASQTVDFDVPRSADAGPGTTHVRFAIVFKQPNPPGAQDCNLANDTGRARF